MLFFCSSPVNTSVMFFGERLFQLFFDIEIHFMLFFSFFSLLIVSTSLLQRFLGRDRIARKVQIAMTDR